MKWRNADGGPRPVGAPRRGAGRRDAAAAPRAVRAAGLLAAERQRAASSMRSLYVLLADTKISEKFTDKSAISLKFQQHFEKICKNHQHVRKSENFEM